MKAPLLFVAILLICGICSAVPITGAATEVGTNNATLHATGVSGPGWFEWGEVYEHEYWRTPNITPAAGVIQYKIHSMPISGSTLYYVVACDGSGCGNRVSFTTLAVTPMPTLTIGILYENMTEHGYDLPMIASNLAGPYMWTGSPLTIVFMLVFSPVFIGVWLRSRTVLVALILGFITGSFLLYTNGGLGVGMPAEIVALAQAIVYLSFAGIIVYILKK
jgi:hypothetical protein